MKTFVTLIIHCFVSVQASEFLVVGSNSRLAKESEALWQILLVSLEEGMERHICGGSLIGNRTVLTAAHCCMSFSASQLLVRYDGLNRTNLGKANNVIKITTHPSYNWRTKSNDICVLTLTNRVNPSKSVQMISIADSSPPTGTKAHLTGWGRISGNDYNLPNLLRYAEMDILSAPECNEKWGIHNANVTSSMICGTNQDASGCNGDSGGPLVVDKKLVGVVSWGARGCPPDTTDRPTVYADTVFLKTWILEQLK